MDVRKRKMQEFAKKWQNRGNERAESQSFWVELLDLYGIEKPTDYIDFEKPIKGYSKRYADGYISATKVLIEQKSASKKLDYKYKQSDGLELTAIEQAERYISKISFTEQPEWVITCNFREFWVYDRKFPEAEPQKITLDDLVKDPSLLDFIVKKEVARIIREKNLSFKAGKVVGKLYDMLEKQYKHPMSDEDLRSLNVLCVRLVFCLYAENSGLFPNHSFYVYLSKYDASELRMALKALFEILNTKKADRDDDLRVDYPLLYSFPYANGGLFNNHGAQITLPTFTEEMRQLLLEEASAGFNWCDISPTIFGAIFESTLNPETRHKGGMHYTTIENIHKVIDPLFLDDLNKEFDDICNIADDKKRGRALLAFQAKLGSLCFLDPACGSGNFLTETYICLRRLENKVIRMLNGNKELFLGKDYASIVKVDITNFYGIEINDFAVSVAKTALWIADHQMWKETQDIVQLDSDFLPLETLYGIVRGNALTMNWESVVPKEKLNYIIGNPPFVGYKLQDAKQKEDLRPLYGQAKNIDYVAGWYMKAVKLMQGTNIRAAFVSTNSICQGEQVPAVWEPLYNQYDISIDFAYRTFRWDSESNSKAHVHCVIVGFSLGKNSSQKKLFDEHKRWLVNTINPYLVASEVVFITKRSKPLGDAEIMIYGSEPREGGYLILDETQRIELIKETPEMEPYIKRFVSSDDFINNKLRYCLWMENANLSVVRKSRIVMERLKKCREFRENSKQAHAHASSLTPYLFASPRQPKSDYLLIPVVSSENRRYIPIGYMNKDTIVSNACFTLSNASLYTFGMLTSNVHNVWMRAVCGRLKSDYRYSNTIVYNNFPWPTPTEEQKTKIEETAQAILDARAIYPDASLSDLYDETSMPPELRKAHQDNDRAVTAAYGWGKNDPEYNSESARVAKLFQMYQELVNEKY